MFAKRVASQISIASRLVAVNKTAVLALGARSFSSFEQVSRASAKLAKALEKEIKYENENYTQLEDIESFLNESGFKFSEQENGIKMSLSKSVGDKKIEILFESR